MADDVIYYVYDRATGAFAGSGVTEINDDTYASTITPPPEKPAEPELRFNAETGTWAWWVAVS